VKAIPRPVAILVFVCLAATIGWSGAQQKQGRQTKPSVYTSAPAQQTEPAPPPQEPQIFTFHAGVTEVITPVTVIGEKGDYVLDLEPNDFALFDNDVRQQIRVQSSEIPISLVVLVGNSAKIAPFLPEVTKTGVLFTSLLLGQQGEAAVITFDHRIQLAQDFTSNSDQLEKAFKGIKEGSDGACLSDALVRALSMLARRAEERRKVIVVIAEDRNTGSEMPMGYALREAQLGNVSIYAVAISGTSALAKTPPPPPSGPTLPPGATGTPPLGGVARQQTAGVTNFNFMNLLALAVTGVKDIFFDRPLEAAAKGTGSLHTGAMKKASVQNGIQRISTELHSQYLVSYRPSTLDQAGFHTIKVTVNRPVSEVRARPGYFFPGPPLSPVAAPVPPQAK
jgi:VWFA-related protein